MDYIILVTRNSTTHYAANCETCLVSQTDCTTITVHTTSAQTKKGAIAWSKLSFIYSLRYELPLIAFIRSPINKHFIQSHLLNIESH